MATKYILHTHTYDLTRLSVWFPIFMKYNYYFVNIEDKGKS